MAVLCEGEVNGGHCSRLGDEVFYDVGVFNTSEALVEASEFDGEAAVIDA